MAEKEESVELFVGHVPKHMTGYQLLAFFEQFGAVHGLNLVNRNCGRTCCCFLICPSIEEAEKIIDNCHNKITLRGASIPLNVKYADNKSGRTASKLFVGNIPKKATHDEISAIFLEYGNIRQLNIVRDYRGISKGSAFVMFETSEQAATAKQALDGKYIMKGSKFTLAVRWPVTEKERYATMDQRAMSMSDEEPTDQNPDSENHEGAFPMGGYIPPPFNAYGYQPYYVGPVFYLPPPFYGHQALQYMQPHYAVMQGPTPPHLASAPSSSSVITSSAGSLMKGPPGANLVVKNIPRGISAQELGNEFQHFGSVLSVEVLADQITGNDQCYGYVSYYSQVAAQNAVLRMNGFQLGDKRLTVEYNMMQF